MKFNEIHNIINILHLKENVDQKSTIEILKRIFENFGPVNFVSLPKFKNSNRIKGFAFVEFSTSEAAQKSCKVIIIYFRPKSSFETILKLLLS